MADKILISDELAQKFIDNAQNHIGISATLKGRVTLDKVKSNLMSGWGFHLHEANKCVCCDHEMLNAGGAWGVNGNSPDMAYFWGQVYDLRGSTAISGCTDISEGVHQQITIADDNQLLPESYVDIKGTCANLATAMNGKVSIIHTGLTTDTSVTMQFFPKVNGKNPIAMPSIYFKGTSEGTVECISPRIVYIDTDPDDKTVDWLVKVNLTYPSGTKFNYLPASAIKVDNSNLGGLSISGSTGATATTLYRTIDNKSINDFIGITKLGFYTSMSYEEPITDILLDVSNCYILTHAGHHLGITTHVQYVNNMETICYFAEHSDIKPGNSSSIGIGNCAIQWSNGQLKIKIPQNEMSRFSTSQFYWMWVEMKSILSAGQMSVRYGFNVYVQNMGDKWNVSLHQSECFIDLASQDTSRLPYHCNDNNFRVKNVGMNDDNVIALGNQGLRTLGNVLNGFVLNIIEINYNSESTSFHSVRYFTNNQYIPLGSVSAYNYINVNLLHSDYFPSMGDVHQAMYSNTLQYDFY